MTPADLGPSDAPTVVPRTVVHLITTLTQGGAERVLSQTVPRPADVPRDASGRPMERHVVVSLADGGMFADELTAAGVEVVGLGMRPGRDLLRGTWRLARLLRTLRPTLVVAWMYHACLLALLARPLAGRTLEGGRTRMVWFLRGSYRTTVGLPAHTRATVRILAWTSRIPDLVAINSSAGRTDHERIGFRPHRWAHLPNGCDTGRFRPDVDDRQAVRAELDVAGTDPLVLFVGRAHPEKGIDVLLDALALDDAPAPLTVALAGRDTEQLSGAKGSVRWLGLGSRDDVARLLRGADALVLPSRTEGMPNAVIEAMASGVPCVVTDVGDTAELVGDTGIVIPPDDPGALATGLREMLGLPAEERERLGAAARERVIDRHSIATARAKYRHLWGGDA